ncbi:MAG: hypothetical protein QNK95_14430 [Paracoccaceae bacterium]
MKPSLNEQLQGTSRILETVVAPQVGEPYARTILDGLIANLRMLTGALPAVASFLRHDNETTAQLLNALCAQATGDLAARLRPALGEPKPDDADVIALEERNHLLRDLLAESVCRDDLSPDQHAAIVQHMSDRASRMPMRYVATAPAPPPNEKS